MKRSDQLALHRGVLIGLFLAQSQSWQIPDASRTGQQSWIRHSTQSIRTSVNTLWIHTLNYTHSTNRSRGRYKAARWPYTYRCTSRRFYNGEDIWRSTFLDWLWLSSLIAINDMWLCRVHEHVLVHNWHDGVNIAVLCTIPRGHHKAGSQQMELRCRLTPVYEVFLSSGVDQPVMMSPLTLLFLKGVYSAVLYRRDQGG